MKQIARVQRLVKELAEIWDTDAELALIERGTESEDHNEAARCVLLHEILARCKKHEHLKNY